VRKSIDSSNPVVYHDCCVCFSRRGFSKKAGHPKVESTSVLRISSLRNIGSDKNLFDWIMSRLTAHKRMGRKTFFPSINKYHTEECEDFETNSEETLALAKRFSRLEEEYNQARKTLDNLKKDNQSLLSSSRNWYNRYLELLYKEEEDALDGLSIRKRSDGANEYSFQSQNP